MSDLNYLNRNYIQDKVYWNTDQALGTLLALSDDRLLQCLCKPANNAKGCVLFTAVKIDQYNAQNTSIQSSIRTFRQITSNTDTDLGLLIVSQVGNYAKSTEVTLYGGGLNTVDTTDNITLEMSAVLENYNANILQFGSGFFPAGAVNVLGIPGLTYNAGDDVYIGTGVADGIYQVNSGFFSPADVNNSQLIQLTGFQFAETKTTSNKDIVVKIIKKQG